MSFANRMEDYMVELQVPEVGEAAISMYNYEWQEILNQKFILA